MLQAAASLVWIPQAALLAFAIQVMADGGGAGRVFLAAAGVLALGIARALLDAWGGRLAYRAARAALTALRTEAAAALVARSPLDPARPPAGLAASVMAEQAEAVVPYFARFRPARMKATLVPLGILAVVLPFSWLAGLILLVAAPLIPLFMALVGWRAKAASEEQMIETGGMNAFLLDRLRGLSTIRALDAVGPTADRLRNSALTLKRKTMAVLRIAFLSSAVLELFSALGVAMVAVYVGFHLLGQIPFGAWGGQLTLGEGLFILLLAPAFFEPLRELSAIWHDRAAGDAALGAVRTLAEPGLALPGGDTAPPFRPRIVPRAPELAIRDLSFRHGGGGATVFTGFSLTVRAGERVALLGASGSGKTTLLSLLAGLAPAAGGRIEIGGQPLDADHAPGLRRRMAWIGQKPHFFAGSLTANITLRRPGIGAADAARALAFSALERVARLHPGRIGEAGAGLSGGEALRLAMARAAADPSADLILADEPTAHLDSITATAVTDGLLALAEGRTLIVATHDPVLAARMDRVVHLGNPAESQP